MFNFAVDLKPVKGVESQARNRKQFYKPFNFKKQWQH